MKHLNLKHFVFILLFSITLYNGQAQTPSLYVNNYTSCTYSVMPTVNNGCTAAITNTSYTVPPTTLNHLCVSYYTSGTWIDLINSTPVANIPASWTWHSVRIINLNNSTGTMIGSGIGVLGCSPTAYPALNAYPTSSTLNCGGTASPVSITWSVNGFGDLIITIM